jgi:hypothetical protein
MSRKIIETFWSWYNSGIDRTEIRALIECDTLTDLPSQDALSGYRLTIGTTAHVIDTNAVYMMQSGGAWKVQSAGIDVYTRAETDALIQGSKDYADGLIEALDVSSVGGTTRYIYQISQTNGKISASSYASDTTPTAGSTKLIQSGGVKSYVDTQVANKASISQVYGIGNAIESGTDLDDLKTAGVYTCVSVTVANTLSNTPITGSAFRLEVKYLNNSTRIRQECYILSDLSIYYARTYTSTGWKQWCKFEGTPVTPV